MTFWHNVRLGALAAFTLLAACAATTPPANVSQGAVSAEMELERSATPEFHGAAIGADTLRNRLSAEN